MDMKNKMNKHIFMKLLKKRGYIELLKIK